MKSKFNFTEDRKEIDLDKAIMNGDIAIYIFKDLDEIINKVRSKKPVKFDNSKFKREYERLKEKWLDEK